ncbi:class I SAM-dependent methyltransferase [Vibrio sp. SCSIO 43135]|uniref:class I SAM-dependent methyltransferase n=1 Tax=Vibrio sp. SCSIO 43135 TaxID=2819096 RepID=UPI002074E6C3|nr:class I SAM-dependent methyltransferase [Vibrio sp. SCSIO 43135]USD42864.1 class I SAM-dependent methyltransferase [Vibrio sp. SCSIO 43135]
MFASLRLLEPSQIERDNIDYIDSDMFKLVANTIEKHFVTDETLRMLDVGGGSGYFADKLLHRFAKSQVTVLDPALSVLKQNRPNPRKHLLHKTFQSLDTFPEQDLIHFNWTLQHLVSNSYEESCELQLDSLRRAYRLLRPGGVVAIFENCYEGQPVSNLPGQIIYEFTASKTLAPLAKMLGANTAGVGVGFHSEMAWRQMLTLAGFPRIVSSDCYYYGEMPRWMKFALRLKQQKVTFIVAQKPLTC